VADRAKTGEKITHQQVKDVVAKHKEESATAPKAERRAAREIELAAKQTALPDKRYGVILADPEWRFEPYSRETGMDRAADNHYPTSPTDIIAARPVGNIAADDCVLVLWATVTMLLDALAVMEAWGFKYKSHTVWVKDRIGTGYWFRNQHEILLVGTRGNIPAPAMGTQSPSIVNAPVGEHSAKPARFLELIEAYFPTLPKIELNRRGPPRSGWDAWGNETDPPYNAVDDLAKSIDVAYEAIRERKANGGPGYTPPPALDESDDIPEFLDRRRLREVPANSA
jgi:N6-adenosine-specific RNA methylase IME4